MVLVLYLRGMRSSWRIPPRSTPLYRQSLTNRELPYFYVTDTCRSSLEIHRPKARLHLDSWTSCTAFPFESETKEWKPVSSRCRGCLDSKQEWWHQPHRSPSCQARLSQHHGRQSLLPGRVLAKQCLSKQLWCHARATLSTVRLLEDRKRLTVTRFLLAGRFGPLPTAVTDPSKRLYK
jgi:hypothetical protein